ncbi:hypothetical protein ABG067_005932, partial [Albugo candida]
MKKTTLALCELSLVESVNQRLLYQAQIAHIRAQLYPEYHQVELALVELDRYIEIDQRGALIDAKALDKGDRIDMLYHERTFSFNWVNRRKLKASVTAALNQFKMESIRHQFQDIYQNQTSMIWRLLKRWILTISTRIFVTATLEPVQPQRSKYIDSVTNVFDDNPDNITTLFLHGSLMSGWIATRKSKPTTRLVSIHRVPNSWKKTEQINRKAGFSTRIKATTVEVSSPKSFQRQRVTALELFFFELAYFLLHNFKAAVMGYNAFPNQCDAQLEQQTAQVLHTQKERTDTSGDPLAMAEGSSVDKQPTRAARERKRG